jgi:hypothetical protein
MTENYIKLKFVKAGRSTVERMASSIATHERRRPP